MIGILLIFANCQVNVYFILPLMSLHTSLNNSVDVSYASFLKLWQCTVQQIKEVAPYYVNFMIFI